MDQVQLSYYISKEEKSIIYSHQMNLQIEHGLSDENEYDFFRLRFISSIGISDKIRRISVPGSSFWMGTTLIKKEIK